MKFSRSTLLLVQLSTWIPSLHVVQGFIPSSSKFTKLTHRHFESSKIVQNAISPSDINTEALWDKLTTSLSSPSSPSNIALPSGLVDSFETIVSSINKNLLPQTDLISWIQQMDSSLNTIAPPLSTFTIGGIAFLTFLTTFSYFLASFDAKITDAPYEPGTDTYDPIQAQEFFNKKPLLVLQRVLRLAFLTATFNTGILFDWLVLGKLFKDEEYTALKNAEPRRAKEALALCEKLGPTFIKLGQALSIRTDILPEAYSLQLRQLQDAVPPFDSKLAYEILRNEFNVNDLSEIFSTLSEKPVASASIGQVYRGTLASNGKDVAVKVQRPGILAEIALDLHVLRILSPIQTTLQNAINGRKTTQEDIDIAISLVDEWGRGFVAETDYRLEARNTIQFGNAMKERGLDAVCAPTVVEDLTRDIILVTEWVEGTRLDRDASPDVPRLCGVAINAYLTMLLDTGVLHCDPHPGNLLRTTDGKLCVLDWGMTLGVPPNLQYALLELIAHINIEDYDSIPQDFINLGFSPDGVTAERLKKSGITEGLTFAFRQLSAGGGPKKIQERVKREFQDMYGAELSDRELQQAARADMLQRMEKQLESEGVDVKGVTNVMEEMSRRNRELFKLPPYVLYVARAFSTLEGIGLSIDENYAIVQECYPYLSRRLFTDRSPRAKKALRAMLGLSEEEEHIDSALAVIQAGARGENVTPKKSGAISIKKLTEMSEGFTSYTSATTNVDSLAGQSAAVAEFTKILLDPKGSTIQDILVDETARLGDAATRSLLREVLIGSPVGKSVLTALRSSKDSPLANSLPAPLKEILINRPSEIPELLEKLVQISDEDERILSSARELRDTLQTRISSNGNSSGPQVNVRELSSFLQDENNRKLIREQLPGVTNLGRRIGAGLLRRAAYRSERTTILPEESRKALAKNYESLANAIDAK